MQYIKYEGNTSVTRSRTQKQENSHSPNRRLCAMLTIPYQLLLVIRFRFMYKIGLISGGSLIRRVISDGRRKISGTVLATPPAATTGGGGTHTPTPPGRRKSAPSFFFYIRERGKKNHRFSLRSTRRQLYESLPWSLDLRHISSDVLHDPSPCSLLRLLPVPGSFPSLPSAPSDKRREKKILFIS